MPREFPAYGIGPNVWGPYFWTTMHIVSLGASATPSKEDQEGIRSFYESLQVVIPCPICRQHYKQALKTMPPRLQTRAELVEWVYDIHNYINEQLGKPQYSWEAFITNMQNLSPSIIPTKESRPALLLSLGIGIGAGIVGTLLASRLLRR